MGNIGGKDADDEDRGGSFDSRPPPNRTNSSAPAGPFFHSASAAQAENTPVDMGTMVQVGASGDAMDTEDAQQGAIMVPTVFTWSHGGREVSIIGTFNGWQRQIPMHRSGNDFTHIHDLPKGKHVYKFVVDDVWRFAPDLPTVMDAEGNINNFIDVSDFTPFVVTDETPEYVGAPPAALAASIVSKDDDVYSQFVPGIDEYQKDPPPLPPHLRHIVLNKPPSAVDPTLLPVPHHVVLNHLYCTAIKDGMMVLGITQRFRRKFVTTGECPAAPRGAPQAPRQAQRSAPDNANAHHRPPCP
jgi:5'-AMP-activated protein kinase, regulatory beta subunit